jgi:hypothetical protein
VHTFTTTGPLGAGDTFEQTAAELSPDAVEGSADGPVRVGCGHVLEYARLS